MKNILLTFSYFLVTSCSLLPIGHSKDLELFQLQDLSGLSSLVFEKSEGDDVLIFWSHTDRGPNGAETTDPNSGVVKRTFLDPAFQPYWVEFAVNRRTGEVKVLKQIGLTLKDGTPLSGLPNTERDELPVDKNGNVLKRDIQGVDPEAMCFDGQHVWMGEEYGPSLLKFDQAGRLLKRYIPEESYPNELSEVFRRVLPKEIAKRKMNRGFEGIACKGGMIYAILQSPLPGEETDVRLIEFDPSSEKVSRELTYPLESKKTDKIGDMTVFGKSLLVLEQNGEIGEKGSHKVYEVNLDKLDLDEKSRPRKRLARDLVAAGYSFTEKVEGLTVINENEIAVVNDNDFSVFRQTETVLGITSF